MQDKSPCNSSTSPAPAPAHCLSETQYDLTYTVGASIQLLYCATGAGKSSLMRILAGQDQEYEGTLQLSPGIKVGYLQQEPVLDMNSTVLENIAPALAPTKAMLTEFEEVTCGHCISLAPIFAQPQLWCASQGIARVESRLVVGELHCPLPLDIHTM